jgi:hypothetical protein
MPLPEKSGGANRPVRSMIPTHYEIFLKIRLQHLTEHGTKCNRAGIHL